MAKRGDGKPGVGGRDDHGFRPMTKSKVDKGANVSTPPLKTNKPKGAKLNKMGY